MQPLGLGFESSHRRINNRLPYRPDGEKGRKIMKFKITIKEVHKAVVYVEANSYAQALKKVEDEYWKNPNDYLLEPEDTFFE